MRPGYGARLNTRVSIDVRRASDRYLTRTGDRRTFHSFSFGEFYDPANLGFAAILAHNDDQLAPGTGYAEHPHSDLEIVTWVLEGALRHTDSGGRTVVLEPGMILRTSAGSGVLHSEVAEPDVPTRFVQTWLRPDLPGGPPSTVVETLTQTGSLSPAIGPRSPISIGTAGARLELVTRANGKLVLPEARQLHIFVASGVVSAGMMHLEAGDAIRWDDDTDLELFGESDASLSVWAFE